MSTLEHMNLEPTPKDLCFKIIRSIKERFNFEFNSPIYQVKKIEQCICQQNNCFQFRSSLWLSDAALKAVAALFS